MRHRSRAIPTALATGAVLALGTLPAVAAPVTDTIVGIGASGTLPSGVTWTASPALRIFEGDSAFYLSNNQTGSLQLSERATVEFAVESLSNTTSGVECVTVPAGTDVIAIHAEHTYDPTTRAVCGRTAAGNTVGSVSQFRVEGVDRLDLVGSGTNSGLARVVSDFAVTVDRDPVVLVDDVASAVIGVPQEIDVLGNDTLPDGTTGYALDTTSAQGGTVADNGDGTVTYTPPAGFLGTDTFTYRVTGPDGVVVEATVTVTVTDTPPPPVPMVAGGVAAAGLLGLAGWGAARLRGRRRD